MWNKVRLTLSLAVLLIPIIGFGYADPTRPEIDHEISEVDSSSVRMIISYGDKSTAYTENNEYKIGDYYNGYRIVMIQSNGVVVLSNSKFMFVEVGELSVS